MNYLLLAFLLVSSSWATDSVVLPAFRDAVKSYLESPALTQGYVLKPEVKAIVSILEKKNIDREFLMKYRDLLESKHDFKLPKDDKYDLWIKNNKMPMTPAPEIALHAFRFDVIEESDDFFNDDIYCYFFVTDGVIPTGKVTSIYKGIDEGQSFFFNEVDRAIFPLNGIPSKTPDNHLIVDYGVIESDGDDIRELQKISAIIIDIAITVYAQVDPEAGAILVNLRKEVKALAELLIGLNNDDRMATGSFGYTNAELSELLKDKTYVEFSKKHNNNAYFDKWEYLLNFRILRK